MKLDQAAYQPMSPEEIKETLEKIMKEPQPQQGRNIVVRTGSKGLKMFQDSMHDYAVREPLRNQAKEMLDGGVLSEEKYNNLLAMIDSPDRENLVLAEEVMKAMIKTKSWN